MEDKWEKVRLIVREECERIESRILEVLDRQTKKTKLGFENGRWTGVTQEQMEAWKAAYGAVDVDGELKRAAAWIVSNPHLAPKNQFGRFFNTWLARQQNQSSLRSIPAKQQEVAKKLCVVCGRTSTGSTEGREHCSQHFWAAREMTNEQVSEAKKKFAA